MGHIDEEEAVVEVPGAGDRESGLVAVVRLLRGAAEGALSRAEIEGAWSVWHAWGLGVYLAAYRGAAGR